jgi:hypothetical protein
MQKNSACDEKLIIRVPTPLRDELERAAAAEGRSLSNMARRALLKWADERQREQEAA